MTMDLPNYADLPLSPLGAPWRSAWGVFGADSQLGTLELLTPQRRRAAMALVEDGVTVNLDHPLDIPLEIFAFRPRLIHKVFEIMPGYLDETLDDFAPQLSSQWDSLRHVRSPDGFYNNLLSDDDALEPTTALGIDQVAVAGVVGRGVLLDVAAYLESQGDPIEPNTRREIPTSVLDETAEFQGVTIHTGDILLVRFGVDAFLRRLVADPGSVQMRYEAPGLMQDHSTIEWLWDKHIAAVCCDNIGVEVTPPRGPDTRLHPSLLGLLGLMMGELFDMVDLARECHARGRYEFAFIAKPFRLPGGVGSPANAMAIF
ncbi:MAG: cyclase family protein [Actinomycetes bacterium]|jgi:kynurenine formamidase